MYLTAPRLVYSWALLAVALHLTLNGGYGFARDEMYFIDCARHLAWGYVDQPPLAVLTTLLAAPLHYSVWAVRLPLAVLSGATVLMGCAVAYELGGRRYALSLCGLLMCLAPPYLAQGYVLSTEFLQPLTWTALLYLSLRLVKTGNARLYIIMALVMAIAMYAKYTILALALAIALAFILTGRRRLLASPYLVVGVALTSLLLLPNVEWQWMHGLPILQVLHGDQLNRHAVRGISVESPQILINAGYFAVMQVLLANPFLAGIWIWGLVALCRAKAFSPYRFVPVTYFLLFGLMIAATARVYYLDGFYPTLFAAGSVAIERYLASKPAWLKPAALLAAFALDVPMIPMTIPILPLGSYMRYEDKLGLSRIGSTNGMRHLVNPAFADQLGWKEMVATVARVYRALPSAQRRRTPIFADRYAYAAAIDLFGPSYGLPAVISPNNSYYLWGTRGYSGDSMIAVGATDYPLLLRSFVSVRQVAVYRNEKRWILEGPLPIYLCTRPRVSLAKLWPTFKYYGL